MIAPTMRLIQVDRCATRWVIFMKYSSQVGLFTRLLLYS